MALSITHTPDQQAMPEIVAKGDLAIFIQVGDLDKMTRELAEPCQPARDECGCGRAASCEAE
ncbi:MAG TPA: hypothetical protein VI365_33695, partial [Trebonia sp.]